MKYLRRFALMVQFLTRIPVPLSLNVQKEDFGKGLVFAPFVGLILGGMLSGFYYLVRLLFPFYICAAFTVIFYVIITGGLHLDGLGDSFDGVFSNRPSERILEIMKDSRVGTNAVLVLVLVLVLDMVLAAGIGEKGLWQILPALALMPAAGRVGCLVGAGTSGYAGMESAFGRSFVESCKMEEVLLGVAAIAAAAYAFAGVKGTGLMLLAALTAFSLAKILGRKIGGVTGDILGAVCELNQVVFLVVWYVV